MFLMLNFFIFYFFIYFFNIMLRPPPYSGDVFVFSVFLLCPGAGWRCRTLRGDTRDVTGIPWSAPPIAPSASCSSYPLITHQRTVRQLQPISPDQLGPPRDLLSI